MKIHAPLLPCLLGLAAGIGVQGFVLSVWWAVPVAVAGFALAFWRLRARPLQRLRLSRINAGRWSAALICCAIGAFDAALLQPGHPEIPTAKTLTGTIEKISETRYGATLTAEVDGSSGAKAILFSQPDEILEKGDRIAWPNALKDIESAESLLTPKSRRYLASQGAAWQQSAAAGDIALISKGNRLPSDASRDFLSRKLEESSLPVATAAFLQSLLLGDRRMLAPEERQAFADSGVAHVLALSGLHMGMLAAVLTLLFLPFNAFGSWKWKYPLVMVLLWLYALLTGFSAPAVRTCVMATMLSLAIIMEKRNSAFNALCAACIVILLADPKALSEPGFQLSFCCVASLILFGLIFEHGRGLKRRLLSAVGACIIATAGSWAVSAWWFGSFPLTFLPANLILLPFLPFYIGAGGVYLLSLCLGADPAWLAYILKWGHEGALNLCNWLSALLPPVEIASHWLVPALWLTALGCLAWFIHSSRKIIWGLLSASLGVLAIIGLALPTFDETMTNGILIRNQSGRMVLSHLNDGEESRFELTPEVHSSIRLRGLIILGADRPELPLKPTECDVLILASGWKGSITPLLERVRPRLLVVHPSVFSFLLDDIRAEATRAGIPVHDLRTEGPLCLPEKGALTTLTRF